MLLNELFSRLGLETDAASFAKGALAAKGVEFALAKLADAARFVTEQLKEATFGVFEQADNLDDLATKTGVSAEALQQLGYAGQFADVSMETIAQSLRILQKNAVGAIDGNKELKDTFRALKVPLVDATGHARSTEDVFADLADRFNSMPEGMGKTNLMLKVFGKSGAEITGVLNLGSKGIRAYAEEHKLLGATMSEGLISGSAEFEDNILRLKTGLQGVRNTIAEAVLPAFNEIAQTTLDWFKANQALVRTKLKEWIEDAIATVKFWIASIREWVKEQGGLGAVIHKVGMYLKAFGLILAGIEIAKFVTGVNTLIGSFVALGVELAITAAAVTGLVAVFAFALYEIVENWDDIRGLGMEIRYVFEDIGAGIMKAFGAAIDWVAEKIDWVVKKYHAVANVLDKVNPFSVNDTSTSGTRGTGASTPALDTVVALGRNQGWAVAPPTLVERGSGSSVSISSAPQINITTHPSQSNEEIGRIAAQKIAEHNQAMLREAQGGLQ